MLNGNQTILLSKVKMPSKHVMDYGELLEIAVNVLNIAPSEFWDLTIDELQILLKGKAKRTGKQLESPLTEDELAALKEMHPDGKVLRPVSPDELQQEWVSKHANS